ncbi:MAG: monovalent cation/H(+) antiporter subunit G [Thermoplasmata archaeon]
MIWDMISIFLISLGIVVMFSASMALLRFHDVFMRLHASAKAGTGGALTILLGLLIRVGFSAISGKVILVIALTIFTGPILSHALGRAAYLDGEAEDIPFIEYEEEEKEEERD